MATLEIPLALELTEAAHWSDGARVSVEEDEFDLLAFELWHLGTCPDAEVEEWPDEVCTLGDGAGCL